MLTDKLQITNMTHIYSMNRIYYHWVNLFILILVLLFSGFSISSTALAQSAIIRGVLFFSPSCGHCQQVITEDLPIFYEKYPDQLQFIGIDVTTAEGQQLYQSTIDTYQLSDERVGVPTLVIGDIVLVGSIEIPETLGGIIESGLATGGIEWPGIPGLREIIGSEFNSEMDNSADPPPNEPINESNTDEQMHALEQNESGNPSAFDRFKRDVPGNSVAVFTLLFMVVSVLITGYIFVRNTTNTPRFWPEWTIPILAVIGLGVAIYLSFIETTQSEAVCGPVGDCNSVQQSPYAHLFGIVPIGIIGVIGYVFILSAWSLRHLTSSDKLGSLAGLVIWGMAWFGVLFSIYLTFLEPFVIGATCMWCITSAVVMTLILLASTPYAIAALAIDEEEGNFADSDPTRV